MNLSRSQIYWLVAIGAITVIAGTIIISRRLSKGKAAKISKLADAKLAAEDNLTKAVRKEHEVKEIELDLILASIGELAEKVKSDPTDLEKNQELETIIKWAKEAKRKVQDPNANVNAIIEEIRNRDLSANAA